ncbi:MAG: anaerobic ribonucleoside triphosphate reductase [Crenarchaeota archaeon]|nr:anaerobic ribonucleoside triphosphate reductase [Thermoproteota archaeon]
MATEEAILRTYLSDNLESRENANTYTGPTGFAAFAASQALRNEAMKALPQHIAKAHRAGVIYVHKLPWSVYMPYCTGHDVSRLLKRGLVTPNIVSRPAKHLDSFVDHVANFLITMQHYFTGAQALSAVELYAGAFIAGEGKALREVEQNVQRLVYNLNYPSRVGLQSPFTNFTVTLDASKTMLGRPAIVGGRETGSLGDYLDEAELFLRALARVLRRGDAVGRPLTFPIPTLMTSSRELWRDEELKHEILLTTAKAGSFYWLNTSIVDPDAAFAMCCRLSIRRDEFRFVNDGFRLSKRDIEDAAEARIRMLEKSRRGGVWAIPDVTGSINVVDVNLPRVALETQSEESRFWDAYYEALELVRDALVWFRERYMKLMRSSPGMYFMIRAYLPEFPISHFSTIGLIGLPEAAAIIMQEPRLWFEGSRAAWAQATRLMKRMVEEAVKFARETMKERGEPWNVEEVPGESAATKLAMNDAKRFPELLEYLPDAEYPMYSTSIAPYYGDLTIFDRVWIESEIQPLFTGGVMMHLFLSEEPSVEALEKLIRRISQTSIVYWSITPAITVCPKCGRFVGAHRRCPKCGSEDVEIWSRIVGYYRPLKSWSPARRKEFWYRKHYSVN